jgi:alpha-L-fucosidase
MQTLLKSFFWTILLLSLKTQAQKKFEPTLESFEKNYQCPDWFRDAKFGIWAHWGPQAVPREGDWYAKKMYENRKYNRKTDKWIEEPDRIYGLHMKRYGHPSEFGFKDIIPLWKAERFDPEALMKLYKRVGAKYFVSMGTHHDNFFLWNSQIHRWNAVQMGPKKDIVGLFQAAAKKEGLRFGISEHLGASYTWYQPSHGADRDGPFAGVPYDGANPAYQDLYHPKADSADNQWLTTSAANHQNWLKSINEVTDMYHPDLLYSDSELPFGQVGREMLAHFYNENMAFNNGKLEAVYNCKHGESNPMWVKDIERGKTEGISPYPWQTDTSIGDWFYKTGQAYKSGKDVVHMLVDIVSKNGNLLLNVVQTPEGDLEPDVLNILDEIANWTETNGEGIYGSRPWKIFGEGPAMEKKATKGMHGGISDVNNIPFTAADFRFTSKDKSIYAFCLAQPTSDIQIVSLAKGSPLLDKKIASVNILGVKSKIKWKQTADGLIITKPVDLPVSHATTIRVDFK